MIYDYVIVGGGSAGCVLANRLSSDPGNSVLLIEAGRDTPPGGVPEVILSSYPGTVYFDPAFTWSALRASLPPVPHNAPQAPPARRYEQARVMGGGSSINGQVAVRGAPDDYDAWEAEGAKGWGWDSVLPYFRRLERDLDFDGPFHGRDGPMAVRRIFPDDWDAFSRAVAEAFGRAGYDYVADMNGAFTEGYFPAPCTNADERRVTTAIGYLDGAARARENLRILAGVQATRLLFDGRRVRGVEVTASGGTETVTAGQVIISAGALHTPALLMRSGVGPGEQLRAHGIEVIADLPGVGANLQDHPAVMISAHLEAGAGQSSATDRHVKVNLRYSSGFDDCPPVDMVLNPVSRSAWHALGRRLGSIQVWVAKSFSRGEVRLASADWRAEPEVRFNLLSDRRDCERLMDGMRKVAALLGTGSLKACARDSFPSAYSERVRDIGRVTLRNRVLTGLLAALMDGPAPFQIGRASCRERV